MCTDNSSIAQLLGTPACTITERSRSNDNYRRIQAQRDKSFALSTPGKVSARVRLDEAEKPRLTPDMTCSPLAPTVDGAPAIDCRRKRAAGAPLRRPSRRERGLKDEAATLV